jgi:hypothetical protein
MGAPAQQTDSTRVMVLVQPFADATSLAMTYADKVPHAEARARVQRLAAASAAELVSVSVRDETVGPPERRGSTQTGVEALLRGSPYVLDRAFRLQPFVDALSDAGPVEVLFVVGRIPGFAGLCEYVRDGTTIRLIQDGAPYRYRILVADGVRPPTSLPVYAPAPPVSNGPSLKDAATQAPKLPVWGVAAACGAAVFVGMLLRGRMRATASGATCLAGKGDVGDHS